jgi:hypothetical protein
MRVGGRLKLSMAKGRKEKENGSDYLIFWLYRPINSVCAQRVEEILSFIFALLLRRNLHCIA